MERGMGKRLRTTLLAGALALWVCTDARFAAAADFSAVPKLTEAVKKVKAAG